MVDHMEGETEQVQLSNNLSCKSTRVGFDIIFEVIPPISVFQVSAIFCALWMHIPAGAIQVAPIVLQAEPGN